MDFSYDEEHEAVKELAQRIFSERSTHERLKALEADPGPDGPVDRELWAQLAEAGLLGIGLSEDVGGAGLDFVATALVVEAAGRTAARVPLIEATVYGAGTIDRFGTEAQRQAHLPGVVAGTVIPTAALVELAGDVIVSGGQPTTTATSTGPGRWRLDGTKACVPGGLVADLVLVPATRLDAEGRAAGLAVYVVPTGAAGVTRTRQDGAFAPEALLELAGVELSDEDVLGGPEADGSAIVADVTERATAALCILQAGACAVAIELIAEYTKNREQFGKPIATFQAVGQRAADAYVDAEAVRLTAWQAAWRIAEGMASAAEVATAKFWAADGGQRVVHAAVHLHGGVGVDREYPLHRYFLMTEQIELTLGGATQSLLGLGKLLAETPV